MDDFNDAFFKPVTFLWDREWPAMRLPVYDQGRTVLGYAFTLRETIYKDLFLMYNDEVQRNIISIEEPAEEACLHSIQEIMERLHLYFPAKSYKPNQPIPERGLCNSFVNTFNYIKTHGVYTEKQCPFKSKYQGDFAEPTFNPDWKIFIGDFEKIDSTGERGYSRVVQCLTKQPLTGAIRYADLLINWKSDEIYQGPGKHGIEGSGNKETQAAGRFALTIMGYGTEGGISYYCCKNSWGPEWGHKGYIKVRHDLMVSIYHPIESRIGKRTEGENC